MRGYKTIFFGAVVFITSISTANAAITFEPGRKDIWDLNHDYAFSWKIDLNTQVDLTQVEIKSASLSFEDIRNWDTNSYDMYVRLLDSQVATGVDGWRQSNNYNDLAYKWDNEAAGDALEGNGTLLAQFSSDANKAYSSDPSLTGTEIPGVNNSKYRPDWGVDVTFNFTGDALDDLKAFALNDGVIALGFDPDCHFWNEGISFSLTTSPKGVSGVPEPTSMLLFGTGLVGLAGLQRRRNKRA